MEIITSLGAIQQQHVRRRSSVELRRQVLAVPPPDGTHDAKLSLAKGALTPDINTAADASELLAQVIVVSLLATPPTPQRSSTCASLLPDLQIADLKRFNQELQEKVEQVRAPAHYVLVAWRLHEFNSPPPAQQPPSPHPRRSVLGAARACRPATCCARRTTMPPKRCGAGFAWLTSRLGTYRNAVSSVKGATGP